MFLAKAELFYEDGLTGRQPDLTKLIVAFLQSCESAWENIQYQNKVAKFLGLLRLIPDVSVPSLGKKTEN